MSTTEPTISTSSIASATETAPALDYNQEINKILTSIKNNPIIQDEYFIEDDPENPRYTSPYNLRNLDNSYTYDNDCTYDVPSEFESIYHNRYLSKEEIKAIEQDSIYQACELVSRSSNRLQISRIIFMKGFKKGQLAKIDTIVSTIIKNVPFFVVTQKKIMKYYYDKVLNLIKNKNYGINNNDNNNNILVSDYLNKSFKNLYNTELRKKYMTSKYYKIYQKTFDPELNELIFSLKLNSQTEILNNDKTITRISKRKRKDGELNKKKKIKLNEDNDINEDLDDEDDHNNNDDEDIEEEDDDHLNGSDDELKIFQKVENIISNDDLNHNNINKNDKIIGHSKQINGYEINNDMAQLYDENKLYSNEKKLLSSFNYIKKIAEESIDTYLDELELPSTVGINMVDKLKDIIKDIEEFTTIKIPSAINKF